MRYWTGMGTLKRLLQSQIPSLNSALIRPNCLNFSTIQTMSPLRQSNPVLGNGMNI